MWSDPYRLYPPRDDLVSFDFPRDVRKSHAEALACFRCKAYVATAIMCRRTLEAACKEQGVKKRTLDKSLAELRTMGIIEARMFEWADELRVARNAAAHDVGSKVSREDARDLLDFTLALLEYVWTFRTKFQAFKSRRGPATA